MSEKVITFKIDGAEIKGKLGQTIMQAADETNSPVIMQGSAGARSYAGEPFLRHLITAAVEMYPHIPIVMHQDHG